MTSLMARANTVIAYNLGLFSLKARPAGVREPGRNGRGRLGRS